MPPAADDDLAKRSLFIEKARRIRPLSRAAAAFASRFMPSSSSPFLDDGKGSLDEPGQSADEGRGQTLGFLLISATAAEQRLTLNVARWFKRERPEMALAALGTTLDDLELMKGGNLFVSGQVARDEFDRALHQYDLKALFLPIRQPLFGHPIILRAEACGLPLAYFDWSFGTIVPRAGDLALDPKLADGDVARRLAQWFDSR
jgi:O-antigen biosynthesis protein